jgi:hypothetical protein
MPTSQRGKWWMAWCILLAFMATWTAIRFVDWLGLEWLAAPVATFVLFSAVYFFAYGVDAYDREKTREQERERSQVIGYKGPGFPKDPFAP